MMPCRLLLRSMDQRAKALLSLLSDAFHRPLDMSYAPRDSREQIQDVLTSKRFIARSVCGMPRADRHIFLGLQQFKTQPGFFRVPESTYHSPLSYSQLEPATSSSFRVLHSHLI